MIQLLTDQSKSRVVRIDGRHGSEISQDVGCDVVRWDGWILDECLRVWSASRCDSLCRHEQEYL